MNNNLIFSFKDKKENGDYDLYLFNDFSGTDKSNGDNVFYELDEIRKEIHSPDTIFIICMDDSIFDKDKDKHKKRFTNKQKIKYIKYKDIQKIFLK